MYLLKELEENNNNSNEENEKIERVIGLQSFSIFILLTISGILSPYFRKVIPLAINLTSAIRGTFALIQEYTQQLENKEIDLLNILMAYYISLILLYSYFPYYRGGFNVAADILPLPSDTKSMIQPFKHPSP